jgi:hypothetical protein
MATDPLSPAQLRFAESKSARPGTHGLADDGRSVFLYHEDEVGLERWLVDRQGHVLDFASFRRSEV